MKILRQMPAICLYGDTKYLHLYIVLADLKGSITFPPQQMPHASTYIQSNLLECWGEKSQRLCARWRRWRWVGLDLDGVIGVEHVWREFKARWMTNKRDFVVLILSIGEVKRIRSSVNKLVVYHDKPHSKFTIINSNKYLL